RGEGLIGASVRGEEMSCLRRRVADGQAICLDQPPVALLVEEDDAREVGRDVVGRAVLDGHPDAGSERDRVTEKETGRAAQGAARTPGRRDGRLRGIPVSRQREGSGDEVEAAAEEVLEPGPVYLRPAAPVD